MILDYHRTRKFGSFTNRAIVSKIPEDQVNNFYTLVEYLGLSDEIVTTEIVAGDKFNLHSPGVSLKENGKAAVHDGTTGHKYESIHHQGIVNLRFKLQSFQNNNWLSGECLKNMPSELVNRHVNGLVHMVGH